MISFVANFLNNILTLLLSAITYGNNEKLLIKWFVNSYKGYFFFAYYIFNLYKLYNNF